MHGDHPASVQVEKSAGGIGGIGMNVAERGRVVSADGQQRQLGTEPASDLAKAGKVGGVAGMINRMLSAAKDVSTVTAMRILENPGTPMAGRHMGDCQIVMTIAVPPIEFDDIAEAEVRDEIEHVVRDHGDGRFSSPLRLLSDGAQGWAMQVVKMRVSDEDNVDRREIAQLNSGLAQPLENKKPARKIGIDDNIFAADLEKEAGVADESDAHLSVGHELWAVSFAGERTDGGMAHQTAKGACTLTQSRIFESRL